MSKTQRVFLALVGVLLLALVVWRFRGRGVAPGGRSPVLIGVIAPFGSTPGDGIRNGVAMAVEEINRAGGIDGRPVEAIYVDDGYSPEADVRAYQQLAGQRHVAAVIGIAGDGIFPVMESLQRFRTPMLLTGVGADRLTQMVAEQPARYRPFFRVMHASSELGRVTTDFARGYLHGRLGIRRFALLVEDGVWTNAIRQTWQTELGGRDGTEVVRVESFSSETHDFLPLLNRIRESGAEYILDASSKVDATEYLRQWASVQGPPIGAIPTGAGTRRYYDQVGEQGISVCSVSTIPSEVNAVTPLSADWWRRYTSRYRDPEYTSGYSYDAVFILKRAVEAAHSTEPGALIAALERTDHTGAAARWVFQANHHPRYGAGYRTIPMIQYQSRGAQGYRIIWPEDRAAGATFVYPAWRRPTGT